MSRSTLLFLLIVIVILGGGWYLSTIDTEVETRTIEMAVPDNALAR
ncbi:MAG: hypothetical protein H7X93_03915 [Sphingomonadaceae bacterium]|nr:hypothetical protein [Sphingomonadaceae bacterium]